MADATNGGKYSLETFTMDKTTPTKTGPSYFDKSERGIMSVLTIDRVDKGDETLYRCIMTNPFGSDSTFIQLVVQGIYASIPKHIILHLNVIA